MTFGPTSKSIALGPPRGEECGKGSCPLGDPTPVWSAHPLVCFGANKMGKENKTPVCVGGYPLRVGAGEEVKDGRFFTMS